MRIVADARRHVFGMGSNPQGGGYLEVAPENLEERDALLDIAARYSRGRPWERWAAEDIARWSEASQFEIGPAPYGVWHIEARLVNNHRIPTDGGPNPALREVEVWLERGGAVNATV